MSRWRPPQEASTALITRPGFERLRAELEDLWRTRRPEVVRALSAAAAEGDRSENAEYIYRKKQLGEIDRRVRYLTKRLESLRVIEQPPADLDRVYFGAEVELEDVMTGDSQRYRVVGPDETDARAGRISIDSPLARALLGRSVDDEVQAALPGGHSSWIVIAIDYPGLAG
ncbi:MAG: transcription elongation factor GreB [Xanthomonadales bacterium]|nr:transcription elongation factor GreB [Xanthomonadales bacterium]